MGACGLALGGKPTLVLLASEPGGGGTRLVDRVEQELQGPPWKVIPWSFFPHHGHSPYPLVLEAFSGIFRLVLRDEQAAQTWRTALSGALGPGAVAMAAIIPELRQLLELPVTRIEAGGHSQVQLELVVQDFLDGCAAAMPAMALALRHVHLADTGSLVLLGSLLQRWRGPLLVVASCDRGWDESNSQSTGGVEQAWSRVVRIELPDPPAGPDPVQTVAALPGETREILRAAALLGRWGELTVLGSALEQPVPWLERVLEPARAAGLLGLAAGDPPAFRFIRPADQAAALAGGSPAREGVLRQALGEALLEAGGRGAAIRTMRAADLFSQITGTHQRLEQYAISAQATLAAARAALASGSPERAGNYLDSVGSMLGAEGWQTLPELALDLQLLRIQVDSDLGRIDTDEEALALALEQDLDPLDRARLHLARVNQVLFNGKLDQSVTLGLRGLTDLGLELPRDLTGWRRHARTRKEEVRRALGSRTDEEILSSPRLDDPVQRAHLKLLIALMPAAMSAAPELHDLVILEAAWIALQGGICAEAAQALCHLAARLVRAHGYSEEARRYSGLALRLARQLDARELQPEVMGHMGALVTVWHRHPAEAARQTMAAHQEAMAQGDYANALMVLVANIALRLNMGVDLPTMTQEVEAALSLSRRLRFGPVIGALIACMAYLDNLQGLTRAADTFSGDELDASSFLQGEMDKSNAAAVSWYHLLRLQALTICRQFKQAHRAAQAVLPVAHIMSGLVVQTEYVFYGAITAAALAGTTDGEERLEHMTALRGAAQQFGRWVRDSPDGFRHRVLLLEAELTRLQGQERLAEETYLQAIDAARAGGFTQDLALATELCGRCYLDRGRQALARSYLEEARQLYLRWGARAKVAHLNQELQGERLVSRRAPPALPGNLPPTPGGPVISAATRAGEASLAEEPGPIHEQGQEESFLDQLLASLQGASGATRGAVVLVGAQGKLRVGAEWPRVSPARGGPEVLLNKHRELPRRLIREVARSGDELSWNKGSEAPSPRVSARGLLSIYCAPMIHQARLLGLIYLEHELVSGAFDQAKIQAVRQLANQACVSLDNVRLRAALASGRSKSTSVEMKPILLQGDGVHRLVSPVEILAITSEGGNYVDVHVISGPCLTMRRSLKQWGELLPDEIFIKAHRSNLVNMAAATRLEMSAGGGGTLYLRDSSIPFKVSRRMASRVKAMMPTRPRRNGGGRRS